MMSQPSFESASAPTVLKKKSALNIYTMLLIIALISLVLGCVFLWLEISEYGGFGAVKGRVGAVTLPYSSEMAYSSVRAYSSYAEGV
jgi:hypothetical protein